MPRTNIYLTHEALLDADTLAATWHLSRSAAMARAVEEALEKMRLRNRLPARQPSRAVKAK